MPEERAAAGAAVVRGKLYVVGGVTAGPIRRAGAPARTALVYDIARRRWSSIPGPTPREHLGVTTLDGRIYAVGGRHAGADTNLALRRVLRPGSQEAGGACGRSRRDAAAPAAAGLGRWLISAGEKRRRSRSAPSTRYDVRKRALARGSRPPDAAPRAGRGRVRQQGLRDRRRRRRPGSRSARRTSRWRFDSQARHGAPAARVVHDVDAVVLPVRAGDAEEEREPAPEAEPALARERPLEHERPALDPEVRPAR